MKTEIIYLLVYLFTEILNYSLFYVVIFNASLTKEKIKYFLAVFILLVLHILALVYTDWETASGMSMFTMFLIPLLLFERSEKKFLILYPFVFIGASVVGLSASFFVAIILNVPESTILYSNAFTILCQLIQSFTLLVIAILKKIKKRKTYQVNLDWKQYLLFYVVAICLYLMLGFIQVLSVKYPLDEYINIIGAAASIAGIVLLVITIWYGIIVDRAMKLEVKANQSEEFINLQKAYFLSLLEQDDKMRKFRHDMNSHLVTIKTLINNKNCEEIEGYFMDIVEKSAIYSIEDYTGNNVIDAVIRHFVMEGVKLKIDFDVKGDLINKTEVSEYDLCTILSNLLKNAIEACEGIEDESKRKIFILIKNYNDQIFISVKNTFSGDVKINNKHIITKKADKKNHGIGIENVRSSVDKYKGIFEYKTDESWFLAEVII